MEKDEEYLLDADENDTALDDDLSDLDEEKVDDPFGKGDEDYDIQRDNDVIDDYII